MRISSFKRSRGLWLFALLLPLMVGSGCSTTAMKGTPFYTGDYAVREGAAENRVNVWPIVYYRDPALSVLWPIFEFTDSHWAVRPLISVYGRDRGPHAPRAVNVLWPLARLDRETGQYRIFPFFWSSESFVLFPFVWYKGNPGGHFVIFPFYWDNRDDDDRRISFFPLWVASENNRWVAWPLIRWSRPQAEEKSGRFWPFFGYHTARDGSYSTRWWLWPLGWQSTEEEGTHRSTMFFPFYFADRTPQSSWWFTPLGGLKRDENGSITRAAVLPLFYRSKDAKGALTLSPFWMQGRDEASRVTWQMSFPFFYSRKGEEGSVFSSLPWSQGRDEDGRVAWRLSFPFFYWGRKDGATTLLTLPWMQQRGADGRLNWCTLPPLFHRARRPDGGSRTWVFPYYEQRDARGRREQVTLWPLFHRERLPDGGAFTWAFPYYAERDEYGRLQNAMVFPLWGKDYAKGSWWTPLAFGRPAEGEFYSWLFGWKTAKETGGGFVYPLTPLVGLRTKQHTGGWLFPLFWHKGERGKDSYAGRWLLLGAYRRDQDRRVSSFFPLWSLERRRSIREVRESVDHTGWIEGVVKFWCLPFCWYENRVSRIPGLLADPAEASGGPESGATLSGENTKARKWSVHPVLEQYKRNGIFPLWYYRSDEKYEKNGSVSVERRGNILGMLYDWKRQRYDLGHELFSSRDYYRTRVLWRVWHYERLNGDVSLDVFPGFTFDRTKEGFRKTSFLWRFYRHERGADGSRKLDLLFLPVLRRAATK